MIKKICIAFLGINLLFTWGCTDLEEQVIDESLTGDETVSSSVDAFLSAAYGPMAQAFRHTRYFGLQLVASDEGILPPRGANQDWYDNGKYIELHRHTFTTSNGVVGDAWSYLTTDLFARAVVAIEEFSKTPDNPDAIAATYEMRALRAYYNLLILDNWGIAFVKNSTQETSQILRGQEAIDYIESEFLEVADYLDDTVGPGRITSQAVHGFLAKLYLNAAVYRDPYGTPSFSAEDMNNVIYHCNQVINSGQFSLSPEYFDVFDDDNHENPELIFAIDQRPELEGSHNRWAYWSLSGSMYPLPAYPGANGTDGPAITPDFYQTWVDAYGNVDPAEADNRFFKENLVVPDGYTTDDSFCIDGADFEINRGILRGVQWGLRNADDGQPFDLCSDGSYYVGPVIEQRGGYDSYVDHTLLIDLENNRDYSDGYRVEKYQFSSTSNTGRNRGQADLVLLRYADIYMMRAEAYLRNGDNAGALADVNFVRTSRTARTPVPAALTAIDLDIMYRERGFEFYWEMQRRSDMIRFGHYEDSWTSKTDADPHKRLFPIPQSVIDAPGAEGYLEQNTGY
ncbi:RagB/SusD family nutrient uptake outer membrane protein [Neptunitalea lumnitzerae]|uniref:Membrane protein n=1 Tax=Neptunitalea lumnitzerae TaxID=2965509 RepID=A0ABQ5MG75_9FLAO|nr:RagB/SusD family nutrient uptake outer membrane protein [Neptunitalea sp. Y10]GLB47907.1 membrane protein [Neptunitalea sp. Y10]